MFIKLIEFWLIHYLTNPNYLTLLPNYYVGNWECDVYGLTKSLYTVEFEIKKTKADYKKDFEKGYRTSRYVSSVRKDIKKHDLIKNGERTNRFFFVVHEKIDIEDVPDYAGIIRFSSEADDYGNVWYSFNRIKNAPLLHKDKAGEETFKKIIWRSKFKYHRLLYEKYARRGFL